MAALVIGPTLPSAANFALVWKFLTACVVSGPLMPSAQFRACAQIVQGLLQPFDAVIVFGIQPKLLVNVMKCPKCDYQVPEERPSCPQCGIIFAKYFKYHPEPNATPEPALEPVVITFSKDQESSWFQEAPVPGPHLLGRLVIFIGLVIWSWQLISPSIASNAVGESFLHNINLPFHEAGHIIFRPFGAFITSLGGTLGQLLMPSVCAGVLLLKSRDPFGASVALWWVGENFLDIAPYVNDARAGVLPLLGGNFGHSAPYGFHDWQYILNESGLLQYDHGLAKLAFGIGSLVMLFSLYCGGFLLLKQYRFWHKNHV